MMLVDPNPKLTNGEVAEIFICTEELDDHSPASLGQIAFYPWPSSMYDAPGCLNLLEFNI